MINRIWAKFELERLAAMWRDGKPPAEIAATLRRTLGAVLNKARETKLIQPIPYRKQGKQAVLAARGQTVKAIQASYLARQEGATGASGKSGSVIWLTPPAPILNLRANPQPLGHAKVCQFILGPEPSAPRCGKASVPGYSYCAMHKAVCFVPRQAAE